MAALLVVAIGHAMSPPRALPCETIHPFHPKGTSFGAHLVPLFLTHSTSVKPTAAHCQLARRRLAAPEGSRVRTSKKRKDLTQNSLYVTAAYPCCAGEPRGRASRG